MSLRPLTKTVIDSLEDEASNVTTVMIQIVTIIEILGAAQEVVKKTPSLRRAS
jgi:hypothetical protein